MAKSDWDIPAKLQPEAADYSFDLSKALNAVVGLRAVVPSDAHTAPTLGTHRTGSGVVINDDGLVLTVGYLITEAEDVWITCLDGRAVPGHPVAFDQETGFGLVQALRPLNVPPLKLGSTAHLALGTKAIFAAAGGKRHAVATRIVGKHEFAGYWEYVLDEALFTAPAHPFWGGAALIGPEGELLGIGSLILQQGDEHGRRTDMNLVVPIDLLPPILDQMLTTGRTGRPARPWLGLYVAESDDAVVVEDMADDGPAEQAGLLDGDRILAVEDTEISDIADLWRKIWSVGHAGTQIRLQIQRDTRTVTIPVTTADRRAFLKAPRLH